MTANPTTFDEIGNEIDRLHNWHVAIVFKEIDKPQRTLDKVDAIARYWVQKMELQLYAAR
jgi:hypothetical protein